MHFWFGWVFFRLSATQVLSLGRKLVLFLGPEGKQT